VAITFGVHPATVLQVRGAVGHGERVCSVIGERTKDGLAAAKAKGAGPVDHPSIPTSEMQP